MKKVIAILLSPFSLIYLLVTALRNHLYDIGYTKSFSFDTCVINVGNLEVGGTGKTPMIEYLIKLLSKRYKVATLSRGYGRKSRGFRIADHKENANTIGDEPYQYFMKFGDQVTVTVGENRAWAIPHILFEKEETQVILMDDAFQHRSVTPDVNILLTTYQNPFYSDYVLPSGRLRESRKGAARADYIIVTKCPHDVSQSKLQLIEQGIKHYNSRAKIYFSTVSYDEPISFFENDTRFQTNVLAFSGIAHNFTFLEYVSSKYHLVKQITFRDHHHYTNSDLRNIADQFEQIEQPDTVILTTEKDMAKIIDKQFSEFHHLPLYYLPIRVDFLKNGKDFDTSVLDNIKSS